MISLGRAAAATAAGLVAASAVGGAIGLATGVDPYLRGLADRMPRRSPALGGLLLTAAVAVPYSVLAVQVVRGDQQAPRTAVVAGSALVAWLVAEAAWLREVSGTEVVFAGLGVATAGLGLACGPARAAAR